MMPQTAVRRTRRSLYITWKRFAGNPARESFRKMACFLSERFQEYGNSFVWKRLRKVVPLGKVAVHVPQLRQLLGGLNPLGDHPQVQGVGQVDHRSHYLLVLRTAAIRILLKPSNERAVDLQEIHRETLEVGERGVAR